MNFTATIIGQVLTFLVLVWFIKAVLWKPMLTMMEARKQRIAQGLQSAEQAERAKQQALEEAKKMRESAREDARALIRNAEREASTIVQQARDQSNEEAARILNQAQEERSRQESLLRKQLGQEMSALIILTAEKIVRKEISSSTHQMLLDDVSDRIQAQR